MIQINRLAIVKLSAMGDIIHAMVALQFIKQHYPHIVIDWIVEESFKGVLQNHPHINEIYTLNLKSIKKNRRKIFEEIKKVRHYAKQEYDLVIDAQGLIKSAIVSKLLGKKVAGFSKHSTREGFASFFYNTKVEIAYDKNVIERNAKVLSAPLSFEITSEQLHKKEPFLYFEPSQKVDDLIEKESKTVLFVIGASWPSKMYSKEKFVKIINTIKENCYVIWGSEEEKKIALYIASQSCAKVAPKLSLDELKALISKADLLIGNDTGPTHMAWALNRPSITLFGNTPGYRNTYTTKINKVIESHSVVNPFKLRKDDFSINEIDEETVITLAKGMLSEDVL